MNSNFSNNFLMTLVQNIRFLIICVLIGGIISVFACKVFVKPKYRATATTVISLSDEYVENATQSLVTTQAQLTSALVNYFDEDYIFKNLAENLPEGLSKTYTQSELEQMFTTTNSKDTFVLKTTAIAYNAKDAAILCNAYVTQTLDYTLKLIDIGYWEMVESATTPGGRFYPSYFRAGLIGAVLGGVLFCAVLFLIIFFNNRVVSRKDLEEKFPEIPVLSEVAQILANENE